MNAEARCNAPLIMIVEDDDGLRFGLRDLLHSSGYAVLSAANGREALDLLASCTVLPSMLLLDLMMPVMNGWELTAAMRSNPVLSRVPIFIMSSAASSTRVTVPLGVAGVLPKLTDVDSLLSVIRAQCRR